MQASSTFKNWIFVLLFLNGCGSDKAPETKEPVPRQGPDFTLLSTNKDENPSLSSDGTKLVFISTRDKEKRVYKLDIPDATSKLTPSLLMSTGVEESKVRLPEDKVWISPSGASVLFTTWNSDYTNTLYKVDYSSGLNPVEVFVSKGVISSLIFSSDSNYFAFNSKVDGVTKVVVQKIDLTDKSEFATDNEQVGFFLKGQTYKLVTMTKSLTSTLTFKEYTFADAGLAAASSADWGSGTDKILRVNHAYSFSLGKDFAYFVQDSSYLGKVINLNGNSDTVKSSSASEYKQIVYENIVKADLTAKTFADSTLKEYGPKLLSLSFSQADDLGVYVSQERHLCKGADGKDISAAAGSVMAVQVASNVALNVPVYNTKAKTWSFGSDLCATANDTELDYNVRNAVVSSGSLQNSYRIVYTSTYGAKLRIYVLDAGQNAIRPIENNL